MFTMTQNDTLYCLSQQKPLLCLSDYDLQKNTFIHSAPVPPSPSHLRAGVELLEDLIDLILETSAQHLISLIKDKHLDVLGG